METKFRAWNRIVQRYQYFTLQDIENQKGKIQWPILDIEQFIGLQDSSGQDFYIGDIAEFDNGDKFVLKMEDWMEVYVEWIGEPECSDQARDLYRISNAKIIGNIHEKIE